MDDDLKFVVYDKTGAFKQQVVPRESSTVIPANDTPTSEFILDDDDKALIPLATNGARCGFWFRGEEWFRGRVQATPGEGPDGYVTCRVEGDFRKLWDWEGWPKPTAPYTGQNVEYARYSGRTEAVFKDALGANFARLGVPWEVAPYLGRGESGRRVEFRFHPLAEKLVPLLDAAGLTVTLAYTPGGTVIVDVRSPYLVPGEITVDTGILDAYSFDRSAPSATRVLVGGEGEGTARSLLQVIDTAREADWGDIIETFVDARMAAGADLTPDAQEALLAGAPKSGVGMDLIETDAFRLGDTFAPGDLLRARVGLVDVLERITQVTIDDSPDEGIVVTPRLGEIADTPDTKLGRQVAALARGYRDVGRR